MKPEIEIVPCTIECRRSIGIIAHNILKSDEGAGCSIRCPWKHTAWIRDIPNLKLSVCNEERQIIMHGEPINARFIAGSYILAAQHRWSCRSRCIKYIKFFGSVSSSQISGIPGSEDA